MSENYALPAIENALILLADFSRHEDNEIPLPVRKALETAFGLKDQTVYLFFEPAEKEDDVLAWLEPWGDKVVTAALLPGSQTDHLRAAMRRIFSRNETRKAVALFVGEQEVVSGAKLRDAFAALDNAPVVASAVGPLLGLASLQDWVFAPQLWEGGGLSVLLREKAAERGLVFIDLDASKDS